MNILFCTSEAYPFVASGGLADVCGSLPHAIQKNGSQCRVVLPLYSSIAAQYREKFTYLTNFTVAVGWRNQYCGVFQYEHEGVIFYFLDNEYYFKRSGIYGFYDDGERFAFFARAALEMLNYIDYAPDIIHTNDWQTALVNLYINLYYRHLPKFYNIKTLFTIHNIQYQGKYGLDMLEDTLGINRKDSYLIEFEGCVNYMKAAIECADKVNTVSPTYAQEILDPWFSHGLDSLLRARTYKLNGILNGIDIAQYNPETDLYLKTNFGVETVKKGKAECRADLLELFDLPKDTDTPVIGMVGRLVSHKGLDLVRHVAEYMLQEGIKMVMLGSGDYTYESFFSELAARYPQQFSIKIGFLPEVAHKIYAGADMFLMPSKSEPCGLAQMVALRYGTVPIVRETGGLKDTITDSGDGIGNGFTFKSYNAHDMLDACLRAKAAYTDVQNWETLVKRDMACNNSWDARAKEYISLYENMLALW
ncbi:MAG: glycogen synthase GlgA [Oscillospiraceae bacterium]|nr:glycogen synthase GlgA [Oscillospiraceae bacterium]